MFKSYNTQLVNSICHIFENYSTRNLFSIKSTCLYTPFLCAIYFIRQICIFVFVFKGFMYSICIWWHERYRYLYKEYTSNHIITYQLKLCHDINVQYIVSNIVNSPKIKQHFNKQVQKDKLLPEFILLICFLLIFLSKLVLFHKKSRL